MIVVVELAEWFQVPTGSFANETPEEWQSRQKTRLPQTRWRFCALSRTAAEKLKD